MFDPALISLPIMEHLSLVSLKGGYKTIVVFSVTKKGGFGQVAFTEVRRDYNEFLVFTAENINRKFSNHSCNIVHLYHCSFILELDR